MTTLQHTGITWALRARARFAWWLADTGRAVEQQGQRWLGDTDQIAERHCVTAEAVQQPLVH